MKAITQNSALVVIGQVSLSSQAQAIVAELREAGHCESHVAVIPDSGWVPAPDHGTCVMDAAATGGTLGGILGLLLATSGTVSIPALAPLIAQVIAQGPVVAALGGVATGGTLGMMVGAVVGLIVSFIDAKVFQRTSHASIRLKVQVAAHPWRKQVEWILERGGAVEIMTVRARPLTERAR